MKDNKPIYKINDCNSLVKSKCFKNDPEYVRKWDIPEFISKYNSKTQINKELSKYR